MIVAVSDLHLGSGKNLGPDRELDLIKSLDQAVNYAIRKKVKYFISLGDNFDRPNPSNYLRKLFVDRLRILCESGIYTLILTGNHEFANKHHALSGFGDLQIDKFNIIDVPVKLLNEDAEWIFLPHNILIDSKETTWKEIFKRFKAKKKKRRIVLGHFPVSGSKVGPSDFQLPASVTKKMLKELEADMILLGDIHKSQKLFKDCYYVGSLNRINFGERNEKKRFIHVTKKLKVKSIEIESRKFVYFTIGEDKYKKVKDAIVKPIINCDEADINKHDTAKIIERLEKAGAHFIMPIVWNIESRKAKKKRTISEINKKKYLRRFIKRNFPKANVDELVELYESVKIGNK